MIRYNVKKLIEQKSEAEGKKISLSEVAKEIGIQRAAMSKIAQDNGYATTTSTLNALCKYFDCKIEDLIEYIPERTN